MRWSKLFIPTLRDDPAESKNATHRLLIRAGYMRRQDYLFLGRRVLRKIVAIIREEMDAIGAQEMLWSSTPSVVTIGNELRSYKQLPQIWYQFNGFTVEARSFDRRAGGSRETCVRSVRRILDRCGVNYVECGAYFFVPTEEGEDVVRGKDYCASVELAQSVPRPPLLADPEGDLSPEEFSTPGQKTIADLSAFTGLPESSQMKSVVMVADQKPLLVMLRGDHQLSEAKLRLHLEAADLRPARADEIRGWFGADAGSLGPVGVKNMKILADNALRGRRNMICGANRNDYHLRNVTPGKDFAPEFFDLRHIAEGDTSIIDGGPLAIEKALVLAKWNSTFLDPGQMVTDESGSLEPVERGYYSLEMNRLLQAAVAQQQDSDGLAFIVPIAPFAVVITPVSNDESQQRTARELCDLLLAACIDTVLDDRDERPGVKFKDADLIGIPYRVTVGKKLAQGIVEIRDRRARASQDMPFTEALSFLQSRFQ